MILDISIFFRITLLPLDKWQYHISMQNKYQEHLNKADH